MQESDKAFLAAIGHSDSKRWRVDRRTQKAEIDRNYLGTFMAVTMYVRGLESFLLALWVLGHYDFYCFTAKV